MSREFTPSSRRFRLMSGIPYIPIVVSQEQSIIFVMPKTIVVVCKLGPKVEPSRKKSQSENGEATYDIPVTTQVGR
jgi:hypothetical protein